MLVTDCYKCKRQGWQYWYVIYVVINSLLMLCDIHCRRLFWTHGALLRGALLPGAVCCIADSSEPAVTVFETDCW